jgi:DNA mismatch repair ATPase MutS
VHKLRRGINRQSHALKVAKLAGMPSTAIKMARKVLVLQDGKQRDTSCDHNIMVGKSETA